MASERDRKKQRKWRLAGFSLALSAIAVFGLGEVIVRLFSVGGYATPDTLRRATLQYGAVVYARHALPQMEQQSANRIPFRVNRRGYRGPDFVVPKPAGTIRIVILGGSQVFDILAPEGADWPRLVEQRLRTRGFPAAEVINAGVPGHASSDSLGRLFTEVWMFEPDFILLCNAWNDIKYFANLSPDRSLLRTVEPSPFTVWEGRKLISNPYSYHSGPIDRLLCHSQLYVRLRNRIWSLRLGRIGLEGLVTGKTDPTTTPIGSASAAACSDWGLRQYAMNLRLFVKASRVCGATPVLVTQPRLAAAENGALEKSRIRLEYTGLSHEALVRAFDDCERTVKEVGVAEGADVLDLSAELAAFRDLEHFHDHVHTEPAGDLLIAEKTADFLASLIGAQD